MTWLGSNLKMALDASSTLKLIDCVREYSDRGPRALVVSAPFLAAAADRARGTSLQIGAQGCSRFERGAHTGEVSALDIAAAGCSFVMVGHAERVAAGESLEDMADQVSMCRRAGLSVILCVGEPEQVAEDSGDLITQADDVLRGRIEAGDVIAYEPHWSIGEQGRAAPADYVARRMGLLREHLGSEATVVYGGSVSTANAAQLLAVPGNSGIFVGRAAWTPEGWRELESIAEGNST